MNSRGRAKKPQKRRGRSPSALFRSALTGLIVAMSFAVQLALPYRQALPSSEFSAADAAVVAAELKATFGAAAVLCVQVDDKGAPSPGAPAGSCCDHCPLCRFMAQATALTLPDAPVLPSRLDAEGGTVGAGSQVCLSDGRPNLANRARAPPLTI